MAASAVALLGYNFVLSLHILWARCPEPYSRYWANRVGQIRGPKGLVKQREVQGWMFIDAQLDGSTGAEYWTAVGAHRLVLAAWERSGYRREGLTVDHRDQVRDHNWIDNLRWATAREQALNRIKSGASWVRSGC